MSATDEIVLSPDPRLSQECAPVEKIDNDVRRLVKRMLKDMYATSGCGLAAPQVGELKQIVVIDVDYSGEGGKNPYVLINPEIIETSEETSVYNEGCLSFPGINADIERPTRVVVQAENLDGDLMEYEAEGNLMAVCLQHEIDHLHGITMVDHLPPVRRIEALRACHEAIESGARPGETDRD